MVTLHSGNLEGIVVKKNNYHSLNWMMVNDRNINNDVDSKNIKNFVDVDQLETLIKSHIPRKFKLSKIIDQMEVAGTIYTTKDDETKILHLSCDSDNYRMTFESFTNLNTGETFVSNL